MLLAEYRAARRDEDVARLRRVLALRAMGAAGMSQRRIAEAVAITQPAVSQQLMFAPELDGVHPELLLGRSRCSDTQDPASTSYSRRVSPPGGSGASR